MNSLHTPYTDATLGCVDLACERGFQTLFEELNFSLHSGQALHIAGANGVGKTSLLRIIATLGLSLSGDILWNGAPVRHQLADYRSCISYLGHKQGLKADLTPTENLLYAARISGSGDSTVDEIKTVLRELGIDVREDRPLRQLSAGQQQRVALARMLLAAAPVWLMDEPATSLDQTAVAELSAVMNAHLEKNGMIVFTSHQPFSLTADRLVTLMLSRVEDV